MIGCLLWDATGTLAIEMSLTVLRSPHALTYAAARIVLMGERHGTLETRTAILDAGHDQRRPNPATAVPTRLNSCDDEVAGGHPAREGTDPSRNARASSVRARPVRKLFDAIDDYLVAKEATANTKRTIEFDRERLEIVKRHLGDVKLSTITRELIEGFQAKRRLEGASNRTVNMDVGALRQVLKRFKQWRRLEDDVKMLTEAGALRSAECSRRRSSNGSSRRAEQSGVGARLLRRCSGGEHVNARC